MERPVEINNQAVEFDLHRAVLAKQVKAWYEAIFVCAAFILLVKLAISRSVPLSVPFAVLVVFQGSCLIRSTLAILRNTSPESQKITKREILIQLFTFLFYIYMTVRIYLPNPNLIYSVIPLSFSNLVYALYKVDYKYKIQEFSVRLEYSIKLSLSFTLLFTGLKETKVIPWNWFYVFWPIWVDALILALIATGQLMNGFRLIRLSCKNQGNCMDSIGPFWLSYCLYGLAICFSYLFISIARDKGLDWANTSSALLTLLIYFIGLFVITFLFNSILLDWMHKSFFSSSGNYSPQMQIPPLPEVILPSILIELELAPKEMKRVSSNFFVEAREVDEEEEIIAKSLDQSVDLAESCSVCCGKCNNAIFMDCGHAGLCFECACEVWKKTRKCMICRSEIEKILKYDKIDDQVVKIVRAIKYEFD